MPGMSGLNGEPISSKFQILGGHTEVAVRSERGAGPAVIAETPADTFRSSAETPG